MPSLSAKLSRESCMRPSNSSRSRESWITRPEAPMGTGGWADRGLWEACGFAEARFKAVPPSSSREKPRPVERPDGRSRPLHFSTKIGTPSETIRGHVFCSFLALVLRQELQARLQKHGHDVEWADVIHDLNQLHTTEVQQD